MVAALVMLHVIVCILLILVILLQAGKGAEMGATFGVGSSSTVFGPRGPTPFLAKVTVGAAVIFMATSLVLTLFASRHKLPSVTKKLSPPAPIEKPMGKTPAKPSPSAEKKTAPDGK